MEFVTHEEAAENGFETFNQGPHLCVNVPDGWSTVSCKLSNGETITFAFCPYRKDGVPRCVDVHTTSGPTVEINGGRDTAPMQRILAFSGGGNAYMARRPESIAAYGKPDGPMNPPTLVSHLLGEDA